MGKRFYAKYKYELVELLSQMFPQDAARYKRYSFTRLKAIYASIHERYEKQTRITEERANVHYINTRPNQTFEGRTLFDDRTLCTHHA